MNPRIKYFIGAAHHAVHSDFLRSVLGGEEVRFDCHWNHEIFPDSVLRHDGEDVVWFFHDLYPHLQPRLKGKQILVEHGLGFKRMLNPQRVETINRSIDLVFGTGFSEETIMREAGVDMRKYKRIGYTVLFLIPELPVEPEAVLFSSNRHGAWGHETNLIEIIRRLDPRLKGYVTLHPDSSERHKELLLDACRRKENVRVIESQQELLRAYAFCRCVVGGPSSVCTPFWFLKKPVIFLKGSLGSRWNLVRRFGWGDIKKKINDPLFHRIVDESTKVAHWAQFDRKLVGKAKLSVSSQQVFFPTNYHKEETLLLIRKTMEQFLMSAAKPRPGRVV